MKRLQLLTLLGLIVGAGAAGLNPARMSHAAEKHDHARQVQGSIDRDDRGRDEHGHEEHGHVAVSYTHLTLPTAPD